MAPFANLSREEKFGLWVAGSAHVALALLLVLQDDSMAPYTPPQRITVSLASEVSLETTAPDPSQNPAVAAAPDLAPLPEVVEAPPPEPAPRVVETPRSQPITRPSPTPTPAASSRPTPTPTATSNAGSRRMEELRQGLSDADGTEGSPGDRPTPQQQASILSSIVRQLRPHWNPPSGVDAAQLVTIVRFRLERDGRLIGNPEVVRTNGQTSSNRAQVGRHQEQAVRAVRLAAPFNLPERFYSGWRSVEMEFNQELAQ